MVEADKIIFKGAEHENLWFVPFGVIPPNPQNYFKTPRLIGVFAYLENSV